MVIGVGRDVEGGGDGMRNNNNKFLVEISFMIILLYILDILNY